MVPVIRIEEVENKGRGVFAGKRFRKGEIIEKAPVITLPGKWGQGAEKSVLDDYFFDWDGEIALALGYGSLYNHSHTPNAVFLCRVKEAAIEFVALRDIEADEEITIDYLEGDDFISSLWFEVHP